MEPKWSLVCSQKHVTCPYPKAVESMPCPPIFVFFLIHFIYPRAYLGFPSSLYHLCFPTKILYVSSNMHATHPAQLILDLITQISGMQLQTMKLSLGRFLQCPVTSVLLGPCIFLINLFLNAFRACSSLMVRDNVSHLCKAKGKFLNTLTLHF
jgi:hypothetical protein